MGKFVSQSSESNYKNVNTTSVYKRLDDLETEIKTVPTQTSVDGKADKTYVDTELGKKAKQTDLDTTNSNVTATTSKLGDLTTLQTTDKSSLVNAINANVASLAEIAQHQVFVSYAQFGAKLNGIDDDTTAIQNAHNYANQYGLPVRQNSGTIRLLGQVSVKTDTDLSGCTVVLNDEANGKTLWSLDTDNPYTITSAFTQSELTKDTILIPSLSSFKESLIRIDSDQLFGYRGGNNTLPIYKTEMVGHIRDGAVFGGGLQNDFTTGTLTVRVKKMTEKPITFKGLKIQWNFSTETQFAYVIRNYRSNVTIRDIFIEVTNAGALTTNNTGTDKGSVIVINDCANVILDNIQGENITGSTGNLSGYLFSAIYVIGLKVLNFTTLNGWGISGTDYIKNLVVKDSTLNRIDCHIGLGNTYCENVHFLGSWGMYVGWGTGKIVLDNCTSETIAGIDEGAVNNVVYCRADWGAVFEGEIHILNHKIINRRNYQFTLVNMIDSYASTGNTMSLQLPSIFIRNLYVKNNYPANNILGFAISLPNYAGRNMSLPKVIDIDSVFVEGESDTNYFQACNLSPQSNLFDPNGTMNLNLRNINRLIFSKYTSGFTTADLTNNGSAAFNKPLIFINDTALPSNPRYIINIFNCVGGVNITGVHSLSISHSKITAFYLGDQTHALMLDIQDSKIYPYCASSIDKVYLQVANAIFKNNTVYCMTKDGSYLPLYLSYLANAIVLQNNYIIGVAESTYTASNLKDSTKGGRTELQGTAAPTTGYHFVGDVCWNTSPVASGIMGWVCVTAGTPGTWKTFGTIGA